MITNVKAFLGLMGYYKRFIAGYAKIVEPLFALTKKEGKFVWTPICLVIFVMLKKKLVETLIPIRPNFNRPFILDVNWSIKGVGAMLSQKPKRHEQVMAYCKQGFVSNTTLLPPYGRKVLHSDMGHNVL
jgi:hypothetical protein